MSGWWLKLGVIYRQQRPPPWHGARHPGCPMWRQVWWVAFDVGSFVLFPIISYIQIKFYVHVELDK